MPPWTLRNASRARAGGAPQHAMRQRAATQPLTQTLIIHVIRTNKISFVQSQASRALTFTTLSIMAFGIWLPSPPLASSLGFTHLPTLYWPILVVTMLAYVVLTQGIKVWLLRRRWI